MSPQFEQILLSRNYSACLADSSSSQVYRHCYKEDCHFYDKVSYSLIKAF